MMAAATTTPARAFAVWWKDLHRWGVKSFQFSRWQWPPAAIKKLSFALERRCERVNRTSFELRPEHFLSIRFTGEVESRDLHGKSEFKGALFFARAGDIIYSRIDVRNGAIGIVPAEVPVATVTSEFPVYRIKNDVTLSEYIQLVFRTAHLRRIIDGMVSGASGRKRVQPDDLENVEIPFPPLAEQEAIVARWRKAQDDIAATRLRAEKLEARTQSQFLKDLGVTTPSQVARPKSFAVWWKALIRFSVRATADGELGLDALKSSKFPHVILGLVAEVTYGIQKCPANRPGQHPRPYLRVANVQKGYLDLSEVKHIDVSDNEMATYRLQPGDILFVEGNGSRAELGRVAKWRGEIPDCVHQNHLIKVRVDQTHLLPDYAMTWFNTEVGRGHFFRAAKTSSGLGTINSNEVRRAPLPIPPLPVQEQIMERVAAGREEIAREREAADRLTRDINAEVEALILGTKKVSEL